MAQRRHQVALAQASARDEHHVGVLLDKVQMEQVLVQGCSLVFAERHDPRDLPATSLDSRVHYGAGAQAYASAVAQVLPRAMARIEAMQGRPFRQDFAIAAYADRAAYAAANGSGNTDTGATTFMDRITLSPRLWTQDPDQLEAYLAHELSHEHLWGNMGTLHYVVLPNWFKEGLAVWASGGGGAQKVSVAQATQAIQTHAEIDVAQASQLFAANWQAPGTPADLASQQLQHHMAYRQAGLFVAALHDADPARFQAFLNLLYGGTRFGDAFLESFGMTAVQKWQQFSDALRGQASLPSRQEHAGGNR